MDLVFPPEVIHSLNYVNLGQCLADDAVARPATIRAAIRALVRLGAGLQSFEFAKPLSTGRYGQELRAEARKAFFTPNPDIINSGIALKQALWWQVADIDNMATADIADQFLILLEQGDNCAKCEGALGLGELLERRRHEAHHAELLEVVETHPGASAALVSLLFSENISQHYASLQGLFWLGECRLWTPPTAPDLIGRLFHLSEHSFDGEVRRIGRLALLSQPLLPRKEVRETLLLDVKEIEESISQGFKGWETNRSTVFLVVAWYLQILSETDLCARAVELLHSPHAGHSDARGWLEELLRQEKLVLRPYLRQSPGHPFRGPTG